MTAFRRIQALALWSVFAAGIASAHAAGTNPVADDVRAANGRFKDVAVAVAEGYAPIPCASGVQGGAMASTTSMAPISRTASSISSTRKR